MRGISRPVLWLNNWHIDWQFTILNKTSLSSQYSFDCWFSLFPLQDEEGGQESFISPDQQKQGEGYEDELTAGNQLPGDGNEMAERIY